MLLRHQIRKNWTKTVLGEETTWELQALLA